MRLRRVWVCVFFFFFCVLFLFNLIFLFKKWTYL